MSDALHDYIEALRGLMAEGGSVMPPLVLCALGMWFALLSRGLVVRRGDARPVDLIWAAALRELPKGSGVLPHAVRRVIRRRAELVGLTESERGEWVRLELDDLRQALRAHRTLASSLVMAAPLLGLLGTVSGMIETFDALGQQAMFRQSGGIAGGIAEALLTTEVGLCIAIPGTIVGRLLDRREDALQRDLESIEGLAERDEELPCAA